MIENDLQLRFTEHAIMKFTIALDDLVDIYDKKPEINGLMYNRIKDGYESIIEELNEEVKQYEDGLKVKFS